MPDTGLPAVTVIIASSCEARREDAIDRAIASVLSQDGIDVHLLLVANGPRVDARLLERLQRQPRLAVHRLSEGSYPAALRHGRSLVGSEFFACLDDDDEYLAGALRARLAALREDSTIDFVATNGYLHADGRDSVTRHSSEVVERDPLGALLTSNWMTPCGHLFRSGTVTLEYFDGTTKYHEWTLLAFRLCSRLKVRFLDAPTYRKHDMPDSLYKSPGASLGGIAAIDTMLSIGAPAPVKRRLARLRTAALHTASDFHRQAGDYRQAWRFHLLSLLHPDGWRHLAYTRRLLRPRARAS